MGGKKKKEKQGHAKIKAAKAPRSHVRTGTLPDGRQTQAQAKKEAQKAPGVKKPYRYRPGSLGQGGKWKKKIAIKNDKAEGQKPVKLN